MVADEVVMQKGYSQRQELVLEAGITIALRGTTGRDERGDSQGFASQTSKEKESRQGESRSTKHQESVESKLPTCKIQKLG
eukprot:768399-Hanusia_phi.AAC.12